MFSFHEASIDRYVSTFTTSITIGVHLETELVSSNVSVVWWTGPHLVTLLLLKESFHDEIHRWYVVDVLWTHNCCGNQARSSFLQGI